MSATTILMLSVDEAHLLERSLPAAAAQPAVDVVVIDNACTDRTATLCEQHGARRIALRERRSYAAAMNAGLAATGGPAVLLLNADCVLDGGFLAAAHPRLGEPGVGSVAPLRGTPRRARNRRSAAGSRARPWPPAPRSSPPRTSAARSTRPAARRAPRRASRCGPYRRCR